ncbi:MAG: acetyl-CoA carboxylase carboxyl transferase subunit alpha [Chloroflexota bacterium]|jgi:acetyl-CoA carboxylase carboxyl transferase subunit alpha|nr:acetyl-CoA carboxylase carboxyl transferase subunit alpha [Chloroflexota bacterium]
MNTWATVELARHEARPYALDYIASLTEDFVELHGDRDGGDDRAVVGGPARMDGRTIMIIAHQKGRTLEERQFRNYGMAHPEGYRKAMRLMRQAERFGMPVLALIDTPGAYPGVGAELSGQAWAISQSLIVQSDLRVPIVSVVIGEGGSGGALALALGDRVLIMEHSIYSVASPEACAAITWRDAGKKQEAAEALRLTSADALELGVVDEVIPEPVPAHLDPEGAARRLAEAVGRHLEELSHFSLERLLGSRYWRFRRPI